MLPVCLLASFLYSSPKCQLSIFLSLLSLSFGLSFFFISVFRYFFLLYFFLSVFLSPFSLSFLYFSRQLSIFQYFFWSFTFSVLFSICYQKVRLFILRVPKFILLPFSFSSSPFDHFFSYLTFCL